MLYFHGFCANRLLVCRPSEQIATACDICYCVIGVKLVYITVSQPQVTCFTFAPACKHLINLITWLEVVLVVVNVTNGRRNNVAANDNGNANSYNSNVAYTCCIDLYWWIVVSCHTISHNVTKSEVSHIRQCERLFVCLFVCL